MKEVQVNKYIVTRKTGMSAREELLWLKLRSKLPLRDLFLLRHELNAEISNRGIELGDMYD